MAKVKFSYDNYDGYLQVKEVLSNYPIIQNHLGHPVFQSVTVLQGVGVSAIIDIYIDDESITFQLSNKQVPARCFSETVHTGVDGWQKHIINSLDRMLFQMIAHALTNGPLITQDKSGKFLIVGDPLV